MTYKSRQGALTEIEKSIVKYLIDKGDRNQDIQAYINKNRAGTINGARVSGVRHNKNVKPATQKEFDNYDRIKSSFDSVTGLNPYINERLIRAREAMMLAVGTFNNPTLKFKAEVFCILSVVAWTYLLQEWLEYNNIPFAKPNGFTFSLAELTKMEACNLSNGVKNNLKAVIKIRHDVEHKLFGEADSTWQTLFQANALNFEKVMTAYFGSRVSLSKDLGFAIQFSKFENNHVGIVNSYDVPSHIIEIESQLSQELSPEELNDPEYKAKIEIIQSGDSNSSAILIPIPTNDSDFFKLKATEVVKAVSETTGIRFTTNNHSQCCQHFGVRKKWKSKDITETDKRYCKYFANSNSFGYSYPWVTLLSETITDNNLFDEIKSIKL